MLLVLPLFDQFVFAEFDQRCQGTKLRLVFATHEVLICGHVLQRIETAIHRLELSSIMKLPEKYHALIAENQPRIREIVVMENKPANSQGRRHLIVRRKIFPHAAFGNVRHSENPAFSRIQVRVMLRT